ncbi:hypothetical protein JAAARDRAFT_616176 [Jaapia argillacea MUCL 33604]|uniref:F-box domain-containing protein n=1 Tax=Jaapia argillacea MUCL 33604 TaxID=933084 RepID=A0A067P783_9AGAM|nr:hypothetical protein JAAARDRAFT_616176 [Jaapia argillacea MUCL 33604]
MSHPNRSLGSTMGFCAFLNRVPLETIDSIIDLIDDRSDILSLSLTCKSFARYLIPSILDYREIRAPFEMSQIWEHIADNPILARRVRKVRVTEDLSARALPWTIERGIRQSGRIELAEGDEAEGSFFDGLASMFRLVSFHWGSPVRRDSCRYTFNRDGYDEVWGILADFCPGLKHLEISDVVNVLSDAALERRSAYRAWSPVNITSPLRGFYPSGAYPLHISSTLC